MANFWVIDTENPILENGTVEVSVDALELACESLE
jgi:hypothetical protein